MQNFQAGGLKIHHSVPSKMPKAQKKHKAHKTPTKTKSTHIRKFDDNYVPSGISEQAKPWPRRLLHVPSMTSYECQSGNIYKGVKEPAYTAISYTWGRYEDKNEVPSTIHGVTWKVPGISSSHFTIEEFQKAIIASTRDGQFDFIWLDVACIDQKDEVVKLDEINKQANIYKRAKWVFAWMDWTTEEMLRVLHTVEEYSRVLGWNPDGLAMLEPWGGDVATDLDSVSAVFNSIAQQGWFTSLWTLQEAFLSRPAFVKVRRPSLLLPILPRPAFGPIKISR